MYSGNGDSKYEQPGGAIPQNANITIDGWDVSSAVTWINNHTGTSSKHVCAKYVEIAISQGKGPLSTKMSTYECGGNSYHATNLRYYGILDYHGFVRITPSDLTLSPNQRNVDMQLQAGDVAIIGKNARLSGGHFHACMWTGSQWVSDFKQNNLNVYSSSQPCAIYRFHNKQGTPKS